MASEISEKTMKLARDWSVDDRIHIITDRNHELIGNADIITNLGFVRPIDANFLKRLKKTAVIPLMWETWEFRDEDIDLEECRRLQIPVLGTNEHYPKLRTFEYMGHLALKLIYHLDVEIFLTKIMILGSGEFAEQIVSTLASVGAESVLIRTDIKGQLASSTTREYFRDADAIVIAEPSDRRAIIGPEGEISFEEIVKINPSLAVVHICGVIDQEELKISKLRYLPSRLARPGHMSVTTDHLGPKPLVNLHTAGLKVGEAMARARFKGLNGLEAELAVMNETPLAQGFQGHHDHFF
jgi:hypothetical protein